ncbi:MAG: SGNH/GDSL hydrolase family protein [Gemmatales bacterium]|nr:SGNH/GDSL hydrolase family protein [Gemmatales bacterium]MDW7993270.1 SGNH/GDSL hydrolase family protein [Gemmatales bacterium]
MGHYHMHKRCSVHRLWFSGIADLVLVMLLFLTGVRAEPSIEIKFELTSGDRIVYYGGTLLERDRHYGILETMFRTRFPNRQLTFRNLAWPGDTVYTQLRPLNFGNMEQHLREQRPSVILVCFGMTEAYQGRAGLDSYTKAYARQLSMLGKLTSRIIVLSPIRQEFLGPPLPDPKTYNDHVALYHAATRQLVAKMKLPYIDLYSYLIPDQRADPPLTENGIHLTRYGYWRLSELLAQQLGLSERWEVTLDFKKKAVISARGTRVENVEWLEEGLRFTAHDQVLPNPAPEGSPADADEQAAQRRLTIDGLPDGQYQLFAENQLVAQGSSVQWSRGIVLVRDSTYQQARKLREIVIEKDILFFHRWRAHNGEYIYGRRSKPGGGNSGNPTFPAEFAELDRLLEEMDRRLDEQAKPRPIHYRLRRVTP